MKKKFYFLFCFMFQAFCFGKNNIVSFISGSTHPKHNTSLAKHNNLVNLLQKASESDNPEYQKAVKILSNIALKEAYAFNIESIRLLFSTLSEQVFAIGNVHKIKNSFSLVSLLNLEQPSVKKSTQKPMYNLSKLLQTVQKHMPTKKSFSLVSLVQSITPISHDQEQSKSNLISLLTLQETSEKHLTSVRSNNLVSLLSQG